MMAPLALKPAMVEKLALTKSGRRARLAVMWVSIATSSSGARAGLASSASSQEKNSHSAAPSCSMAARTLAASLSSLRDLAKVVGLIASTTFTPCATAARMPAVTRRASSSRVAPSGRADSAVAAFAYGARCTPSDSRRARTCAGTLPSPTNRVASARPTSACARNTGLKLTSAPRRLNR